MSRLPVHRRSLAQGSGAPRLQRLVECPAGRQSVSVEACGHCGYGRGDSVDEALGAEFVECERAPEPPATGGFDSRLQVVPAISLATRDVLCVAPDVSANDARRIFIDHTVGCVPVIDASGRPIGILTALDLVRTADATRASDAMTAPVATIGEMTTVTRAAALMAFEGIHHLPIVNQAGQIVALLSSTDILRHIGRQQGFLVPEETQRRRAQSG